MKTPAPLRIFRRLRTLRRVPELSCGAQILPMDRRKNLRLPDFVGGAQILPMASRFLRRRPDFVGGSPESSKRPDLARRPGREGRGRPHQRTAPEKRFQQK
jgi:hypothetical protein